MNHLTTKQKIILGVIVGIMLIVIGIYGYLSLNQEEDLDVMQTQNDELSGNEQNNGTTTSNSQENQTNQGDMSNHENLEGKIIIHITGEVKKTGILILPEGARIADAIEAAGGVTKEANLDKVNLAYVLEDAQKLVIPNKKDKEDKEYITSESGDNVIVDSKTSTKGGNTIVNINTATQSELESLPGIGASIASRIVEYREKNGKFQKIEDLQNVKGIGDAKFANVKEYITVK